MVSASNSSYTVKSSKHSGIAEMCKSVKWPSSIKLKPFKQEGSLRQRTSAHPCFADANPLYLESSPSASEELSLRGTWRDLCSQVLSPPLPSAVPSSVPSSHGGIMIRHRRHRATPTAQWPLWRAGHIHMGPELPTQTSGAQPCFEASGKRQRAKPNKPALQKGFAFQFATSHWDATGTRLTAVQPREPL